MFEQGKKSGICQTGSVLKGLRPEPTEAFYRAICTGTFGQQSTAYTIGEILMPVQMAPDAR
jgi:hypothetical protein